MLQNCTYTFDRLKVELLFLLLADDGSLLLRPQMLLTPDKLLSRAQLDVDGHVHGGAVLLTQLARDQAEAGLLRFMWQKEKQSIGSEYACVRMGRKVSEWKKCQNGKSVRMGKVSE